MRINDATLNYTIAIADLPAGGNIGTAATTVDIASSFNINQTTAGQTITLPNPTDTTAGRTVIIANVGSVAFTLITASLSTNEAATMLWNGTTWVFAGIDPSASTTRLNQITAANGVNGINNLNHAQLWSWNTLTNQNALSLFSTTITSGTLLQVGSSSANIHPGALVKISSASATATGRALEVTSTTAGAMTNGIIYGLFTGAFTNEGIKYNATTMATGTLMQLTTGAMTSGNILQLQQQSAAATGPSLLLTTSQTAGSIIFMNNATIATGAGINLAANAISTGAVAQFVSSGATITTGSILRVLATVTGTPTNGLVYFQNNANSPGVLMGVENATTTGTTLRITSNSLTTGTSLEVRSTSATQTGNSLLVSSASTSAFTNGAARLNLTAAHTGNGLQIDTATQTGNAAQINATAITTGYGLGITTNANTSKILRLGNSTGTNDIFRTTASPEGVITGTRGDIAIYNDASTGGAYVKATGAATNTGWEKLNTDPSYAYMQMTANATATAITAANTPILIAGTTTLSASSEFTMPANNRLTYTGLRTKTFQISANVGFWVASNNRACYFYVYKNGIQEASSKQGAVSRNTGESQDAGVVHLLTMATNDFIEIWTENAVNAHDITAQQLHVIIQSIN